MAGFPVLTTMQGPPVTDLYDELHLTNCTALADSDSDALVPSLGHNVFSHAGDTELFQEQFVGGTLISSASLATLLASRSSLQENPSSSAHIWDVARTHALNGYSDALNISFATSMNGGYDQVDSNVNGKYDFNKYPVPPELVEKSLDPNGFITLNNEDHPYGSSFKRTSTVLDMTHHCSNEKCNSKELSLSFGSQEPPEFSQPSPGSRYLQVIQEILSQIASYSLENLDQTSYSVGGTSAQSNLEYSSSSSAEKGTFVGSEVEGGFELQMDPQLQKQALETKKTQLLTLLQVVDDRYNQCMDEIHTVVSAFHAATELDPQKHASFALRTISFLYKNLRERISNQILSIGAEFNGHGKRGEDLSFEASFIQKQWTLQQQKRKEHQLWRPQRGLPEKSVSVLRAWMFQNFLHPYPKDAEKHLLAIKSGLSRSQVSNWFINARVRLWKPMIEEMYSEMNKRKARELREEEGNNTHYWPWKL